MPFLLGFDMLGYQTSETLRPSQTPGMAQIQGLYALPLKLVEEEHQAELREERGRLV